MNTSAKGLGIDWLSFDEQLRLVEEIWDTIAQSAEAMDLPRSHRDELDRRLQAQQRNPHAGSSWEAVKSRLQSHQEPPK